MSDENYLAAATDKPVAAHSRPKQSLKRLGKWLNKWLKAQKRGVTQRAGEPDADFVVRANAEQHKCADAIKEIQRAISVRQSTNSRINPHSHNCIPKKKLRECGELPPVGYKGGLIPVT